MPTVTPVFGMFGSGNWTSDERPTNWRQELLRNYPRGSMPLTAIMSKAGKEAVSDPTFHWWEKDLATMAGAVTGVYTGQSLAGDAEYVDTYPGFNAPAGITLYIKVDGTADDPVTSYLVPGSIILLTKTTDYRVCIRARVMQVNKPGTASDWIRIVTLTADKANGDYDIGDANYILVLPTLFSEFAGVPQVIRYKPGSFYNHTSIKKAAVAESRTAMAVKQLRPNSNDYKEAKREALENLGIQMEMELIYGTRFETTDPTTNMPFRGSMGIREYIETYGLADNIWSYKFDTDYSAKTWLQGGYDALMHKMLDLATYCDLTKTMHIVGNGVKLGLNLLAERRGNITLTPQTVEYGLAITRLTTPFGEFTLVDAPLFNRNASLQYSWLGVPNNSMKYRYVEGGDIHFLPDVGFQKGGLQHVDGIFELWLVENGYEFHNSKAWFWLQDVGLDNVV